MRRFSTALLIIALLLAGAAALLWVNRIAVAEWAIDTYQPETPLGPISVRIADITLSTVTITEIRARYRGPISVQDTTVDFGVGERWQLALPSIRIGSLNAALSFADWVDLIDTLAPGGSDSGETAVPRLPLSIGEIVVETIDLYAETPKGYALLNGTAVFRGGADLSQADALPRLAEGLEGDLLLSAGAVGFPVKGGAMGGGSLVLAVSVAGKTARVEAVTPLRIDLEIAEPLAALPELPAGIYRADIGADDAPFRMTLGYDVDPAPALRTVSFAAFPFALDTPFGTAQAHATTEPVDLTNGVADPAGMPVGLTGSLNLTAVPLPGAIKADIAGGFKIDKGATTAIALAKGFRIAADLSAADILADMPAALRDMLSKSVTLAAASTVAIDFATDDEGDRVSATGALALNSGGLSAALPSGLSLRMGRSGGVAADVETATLRLDPGTGPSPVDSIVSLALGRVSLTLAEDGGIDARGSYALEAEAGQSKGNFLVEKAGGSTVARILDGSMAARGPALSAPAFHATARIGADGIDLSAAVEEVRSGDLRVLKRPLVLMGNVKPDSNGDMDFTASGSIDDVVAVQAKGHYVGGDVVMSFGTGDIPLGPGGADLSELTDLVDLGRSDPNGSIRVDGELTYQHGAVSGYADLHIAEIGSVLADGTAISVLGTVSFDLSRPPATLSPATLTGSLTSDILGTIPFKETFSLRETGEMEVQSLEAQFLGGTVTILEGLADPAAGSLTGRIHAAAIDLDALADMLNIEGLEGTGRLTGDLGFQVTEKAVIVERGELMAEKPGILRYRGEALRAAATGNEDLALLVQALENFHYEVLTLGIDIPEFGEGIVTLHLEGNNPDVLDGHPFDVTINLESEYGRLIKTFLTLYKEMDVILQRALR